MLVNTRAIVLNTLKYGESQVIADLLTEEYGRLSFIISVTRSRRSVRKTPMLQPLTILSVCFDHRPQRRLGRIKEATVAFPAVSFRSTQGNSRLRFSLPSLRVTPRGQSSATTVSTLSWRTA